MAAKVGEILLFNVGEGTLRPFLVVVAADDAYSGELFLDHVLDKRAEWVIRNVFTTPWEQHRTLWVKGVTMGLGVGQIRFRAQSAATSEPAIRPIKPPIQRVSTKEGA